MPLSVRARTGLSVFPILNTAQSSSLLTASTAGNLLLDLTKLRNSADPSFKLFSHLHVVAASGTTGEVVLTANGTAVDTYAFSNTTAAAMRRDVTAALASYTGVVLFNISFRRTGGLLGSVTVNCAQLEREMDEADL